MEKLLTSLQVSVLHLFIGTLMTSQSVHFVVGVCMVAMWASVEISIFRSMTASTMNLSWQESTTISLTSSRLSFIKESLKNCISSFGALFLYHEFVFDINIPIDRAKII